MFQIFLSRYKLIHGIILTSCVILISCDTQDNSISNNTAPRIIEEVSLPESNNTIKPEIENKSYLFNVTDHSIEELEALLERAEEVSQTQPAEFEDLEIVMIIHGPDIDWFKKENHQHNQKLIKLAEKLDSYDVIDMKVCEATMNSRGVNREEIPSFIESVPFAPTEIKRHLEQGYINL